MNVRAVWPIQLITVDESPKARLKLLRDKLAAAVPRARIRANTPRELMQRLEATAKQVGNLYLLSVSRGPATGALDDAIDDVLVEGHLLLHEVERLASEPAVARAGARGGSGADRRQHERHDTHVMVRLLRHSTQIDGTGSAALASESATRAANNVSVGGVFVSVPQHELTQVTVGGVVHVEVVGAPGVTPFRARAIVMRRDGSGLGLRWVEDSERVRRDIVGFLDEARRVGRGAGVL